MRVVCPGLISNAVIDCLKNIDAVPCHGYRISYFKESVKIAYPNSSDTLEKRPEGCSFQHGRFIQNLRQAATNAPNVTGVEAKATKLLRDEDTGKVIGVLASSTENKNIATEVSRQLHRVWKGSLPALTFGSSITAA